LGRRLQRKARPPKQTWGERPKQLDINCCTN